MPRTIPWPDNHNEELLKLWNEGYSGGYIASLLGYTRSAVMGKVHRMRKRAGETPKRRATVKAMENPSHKPKPKPTQVSKPAYTHATPPKPLPVDRGRVGKLTIMELTSSTCRWPYGHSSFTFCGDHIKEGSPYCPKHSNIAFPRSERFK